MLLAIVLGIGLMIADHAVIAPMFNQAPPAATAPDRGKNAQIIEQMMAGR